MRPLETFRPGQRVHVVTEARTYATLNADGRVARVRTDGGAWVALDQRSKVEAVHPFEADDDRGTHVMTYPDLCTMPTGTGAERRAAERFEERPAVTPATFGRDHWSTFAYLEHAIVDRGGDPERCRMRCNAARHPALADRGMELAFRGMPFPATRLKGGDLVPDHDDWDCALDLEKAGLLENVGTGANPIFQMTGAGWAVATLLRQWKATGGTFDTFNPAIEARPAAEVSP